MEFQHWNYTLCIWAALSRMAEHFMQAERANSGCVITCYKHVCTSLESLSIASLSWREEVGSHPYYLTRLPVGKINSFCAALLAGRWHCRCSFCGTFGMKWNLCLNLPARKGESSSRCSAVPPLEGNLRVLWSRLFTF